MSGGGGGKFLPGVSGNPAGRTAGSRNRMTVAVEAKLAALGCDPVEGIAHIAMDLSVPAKVRLHAYCELAALTTPKIKPESARRDIPLEGSTLEEVGRSAFELMRDGTLTTTEAAEVVVAVGRQAIAEQMGMIADVVARLAIKAGETLPPGLEIRTRTPVTITAINQAPSGDSAEKRS